MDRRRRKPFVLASTQSIVGSILNSDRPIDPKDFAIRLKAGILRFSGDPPEAGDDLREDAFVVGLSVSDLRRMAVVSGSLVIVKNLDANIEKIARIVALDRPSHPKELANRTRSHPTRRLMNVLPELLYSSNNNLLLDSGIAYVSPILAFNLGLQFSCLKVLVSVGEECIGSLFEDRGEEGSFFDDCENKKLEISNVSSLVVELIPIIQVPRYATHVRLSFVKIPESGNILRVLKGRSETEEDDRQCLIDEALQEYFKFDRLFNVGDIFYVYIRWKCHSDACVSCILKDTKSLSSNIIYFKVMAIEPLNESVLVVNRDHTSLVLGGSVSSGIPSDIFVGHPNGIISVHRETTQNLANIIAPAFCPLAFLVKHRVSVFLHGPSGCGKRTVVRFVARRLGLHVVEFDCHEMVTSSEKKASDSLEEAFKEALRYTPCILLLRHIHVLASLTSKESSPSDESGFSTEVASIIRSYTNPVTEGMGLYTEKKSNILMDQFIRHQVLLVATTATTDGSQLPFAYWFSHEIAMKALNDKQRASMLSGLLRDVLYIRNQPNDELLEDVIRQTSGFLPTDILALVAEANAYFVQRFEGRKCDRKILCGCNTSEDDSSSDAYAMNMEKEDLSKAFENSKKRSALALGTPQVPNVKWEDVGGLEDVKELILKTLQLPLLHKDLYSSGLQKKSGILLYGPPGTGKTLLAKAVATECSLNFISVKGPELINMYIGESEKNVREIFQKARSACPCVIFFDEMDSLFPARGASGDSGGVMDRVVAQFLPEIDGINDDTQDLFVMGATNRPDLIDSALLRPGRFEHVIYVGINADVSYRESVLTALTRKFKLHENVSIPEVAKRCPPNLTGADMYALSAESWELAAIRTISELQSGSSQDETVVVEIGDFMKALRNLRPSVPMTELRKLEEFRDKYSEGRRSSTFS